MGVTRQNHQLMLPFTEVEAGEARGNHRQGAEAPTAAYETEPPVSSTQAINAWGDTQPTEPPCTDPYARWCGRGRAARPAPIPIPGSDRRTRAPPWVT